MRRVGIVLVFVQALVAALAFSAEAGEPTAAAFPRGAASKQKYPLAGAADDDDDEFEFDLDLSSKQKLQGLHQHLDGEDVEDSVEVIATADGDARPWSPSPDLSSKVKPSGFNYGRGVGYVTTQDVFAGDVLFSIPFTSLMNIQSASLGRTKALIDANPDLPPAIVLALHLLEEKFRGEASRFHDYVDSLPGTAPNSSIFYREEELELLRGSHLHRSTAGRLQALSSFYDALVGPVTSKALDPPLFTKDQFTQENFAWAMGTVWSRAFPITGDEKDVIIAPILDTIGACLDESCQQNRIEWDRQAQRLVVYATQDYDAGEEVLLDLAANKSTTLLMLNYGFARANPYAQVEALDISIFLDPNDTLISIKSHLLETHSMSINSSYVLRYGSTELDPVMVKSLKLKLLAAPELDKYGVLLDSGDDASPVVSLRNEFVFTRALVMTCKNLLGQYSTSLDHDRAQVKQLEARYQDRRAGVADRKLQLLRALVIEKEILQNTMDLALKQWNELLYTADATLFGL